MVSYQDVYPSPAILRSFDIVRPRAAELLNLEYFEAEPARMPHEVFSQHLLLLNLRETPMRVENWRDATHRDFIFLPNEIVLTPAGIRSGWYWHERSKVIVITIMPDVLYCCATSELGLVLGARQLRDTPQAMDADLCQSGAMLLDALRTRAIGSEVMYESLARIFLVKLIQHYGELRSEALDFSRGFTASHYKRVLDYVAERFGELITIEEMARVAGLSPAHFSRRFKEVLGDSPYQFVMDYRVEQAKRMLSEQGRPTADIALACGFADQAHLSRIFKRLTEYTPRAFRSSR
ncbi:helix-turn-helix domain-containing protein [Blastomonas sp. RAC04]|uniref:helix-turn-helix domain-containing protein n=1 Tax=Blastomonas sp. RAC04 TaxID=1842535 RepID=UPI001F35BD40|nr:AraC family transcriptional regulator [Blastomonas sp. RAC04]